MKGLSVDRLFVTLQTTRRTTKFDLYFRFLMKCNFRDDDDDIWGASYKKNISSMKQ